MTAVAADSTGPEPANLLGWLLYHVPLRVASDPCGGLSRADLARCFGVHPSSEAFSLSLRICYRRGQIDFVRGYVVAPALTGGDPSHDE